MTPATRDFAPQEAPTLILGAGLTGLSCAYHLEGQAPYRIIEKDTQVGGLAKTRTRPQGFLCDGTGHWLHLKSDQGKQLVHQLLGDSLKPRQRKARVYSRGTYTLYPFQANTHGLPQEVIAECLLGFVERQLKTPAGPPKNYREWIEHTFGDGIARHFMLPYNRKLYGVPLENLAATFAEKYIPRPSLKAVIDGALGLSKEALGYNREFLYPKEGGIGALPEALHRALNKPAERSRAPQTINFQKHQVHMEDGEVIAYKDLVSTIPLPDLVSLLHRGCPAATPGAVLEAKNKLRANTVLYFDVGIRGAASTHQDYHWVYLPESAFPFYRVGSYSAVEPSLAPKGHRSYYVEIAHIEAPDPQKYEALVLEGLKHMGILQDERDLVFMTPNILSPAYVLFDAHYESARRTILDWLEQIHIISVGRYGRWQYNAMEDALLEGIEAANISLGREP